MQRRWFGSELTAWALEELGIKTWPKKKATPREILATMDASIEMMSAPVRAFDAKRRARAVELVRSFELPIDPTAATDEQLERAVQMELTVMVLRDQIRNKVRQEKQDGGE